MELRAINTFSKNQHRNVHFQKQFRTLMEGNQFACATKAFGFNIHNITRFWDRVKGKLCNNSQGNGPECEESSEKEQ